MYKTVRKGDASLQYTILPQTDQFFDNGPPMTPPPSPSARDNNCLRVVYKYLTTVKVILYKLIIPAIIICMCVWTIIIILSETYAANGTRYDDDDYIDVDDDHTVSQLVANPINIHNNIYNTNNNNNSNDISIDVDNTTEFITLTSEAFNNYETTADNYTTSLLLSSLLSVETSPPTPETSSKVQTEFTDPATTTTTTTATTSGSSTSTYKKAKMPRVTLKLRENETIPQMYMKAGIASYKKGNITTSVLAHGLSLEGLIFKTPEGTIKPWKDKWPFGESSLYKDYSQWKKISEFHQQMFAILVTLMVISILIFCILTVVQLKAHRRKCQTVEEPLLNEKQDEEEVDHRSKLLDSETKDDSD
ncbi:GSCOCG00010738001-RA-CDS [Cotesia congregata]|nr:GSCOCG00010738001-RA-CDS [Cotesia congregata]